MFIACEVTEGIAVMRMVGSERNPLAAPALDEIAARCAELGARADVRVVVLESASVRFFSVGVDHSVLAQLDDEGAKGLVLSGHRAVNALSDMPVPTIACVGGAALGGGWELALACDFTIASKRALFGLPEANLGLIPAFGGLHRLVTLAGPMRAMELAMSGRTIRADEALAMRTVLDVVEPTDLVAATRTLAERLCGKSADSLRHIKAGVRREVDVHRAQLDAAEAAAFSVHDLRLPR